MPTVNVFIQKDLNIEQSSVPTAELKAYIAQQLTCGDITLRPEEVSVRFISAMGNGMIAPIEVEITAHAFPERVAQQDDICLRIREFLCHVIVNVDIRVWLLLPELGHSWTS